MTDKLFTEVPSRVLTREQMLFVFPSFSLFFLFFPLFSIFSPLFALPLVLNPISRAVLRRPVSSIQFWNLSLLPRPLPTTPARKEVGKPSPGGNPVRLLRAACYHCRKIPAKNIFLPEQQRPTRACRQRQRRPAEFVGRHHVRGPVRCACRGYLREILHAPAST